MKNICNFCVLGLENIVKIEYSFNKFFLFLFMCINTVLYSMYICVLFVVLFFFCPRFVLSIFQPLFIPYVLYVPASVCVLPLALIKKRIKCNGDT